MSKYPPVSQASKRTTPARTVELALGNSEKSGWRDAAPAMAAVTTLVRVSRAMVAEIESRLEPFDLSFARFEILRLLGFTREGHMPIGRIGERLQVHPASVTSATNRLERAGLVGRTRSSNDHRVVLVHILDRGRTILEPATKEVNTVFESLLLSPEEFETVIQLLTRMTE